MYWNDGKTEIGRLGEANRINIPFDQMPVSLRRAVQPPKTASSMTTVDSTLQPSSAQPGTTRKVETPRAVPPSLSSTRRTHT